VTPPQPSDTVNQPEPGPAAAGAGLGGLPPSRGKVAVVRHGQTEWSLLGRHTSVTDLDLTPHGVEEGHLVPDILHALGIEPATVLVSPRLRARRTAALALPAAHLTIDEDLAEWNYGDYEGLTPDEIAALDPDWLFTSGSPGGESRDDVVTRIDRLLDRARALAADGDVALFCHGHISRVIVTRWAGLDITSANSLEMDPAHVTVLSVRRGIPRIEHHNVPPLERLAPNQ
jgi:broad specificity phosphatase PhoE